MNQHTKYLRQRSFSLKILVWTVNTHTRQLLYLDHTRTQQEIR